MRTDCFAPETLKHAWRAMPETSAPEAAAQSPSNSLGIKMLRPFPITRDHGPELALQSGTAWEGADVRVGVPRMGERVAPCLEYCAVMAIFTIENGVIVDQHDFPMRSRDPFDRVRLLRDQRVDTIICGGVQGIYEDALRASGIRVISWVSGPVDDLLGLFLRGALAPGDGSPMRDAGAPLPIRSAPAGEERS
jgi:predicted Fe-Mo cluster-binding NifX family protein